MEGVLPPYAQPWGPLRDDAGVIRAFLRREPAGYSDTLHTEGPVLLAFRDVPAALRIGPTTVLVRTDLVGDGPMDDVKAAIESGLGAQGIGLLDNEPLLAIAVALQMVGIRLSSWDLWGTGIDEAFADLRGAATGAEWETTPDNPIPPGLA